MSYEIAINKAWVSLASLNKGRKFSVKFLADEYSVDLDQKQVLSLSCNAPAKDFTAILLLHYLIRKQEGLPVLAGEWLTFREFSGIEGYFDAFRKRAIEPVLRKYGKNPSGIFSVLEKLPAKKALDTECGVIINTFEGVPVLIKVFKADEEFGPDANIYFDRSITKIFCTEDIIVLAGLVAYAL